MPVYQTLLGEEDPDSRKTRVLSTVAAGIGTRSYELVAAN